MLSLLLCLWFTFGLDGFLLQHSWGRESLKNVNLTFLQHFFVSHAGDAIYERINAISVSIYKLFLINLSFFSSPQQHAWKMQSIYYKVGIVALVMSALIDFSTAEPRVVCYYTNWSVYRPGTAKFNPQNINPYLCTHLIYAFGGFTKDNQLKPFDKYQDIEQGSP